MGDLRDRCVVNLQDVRYALSNSEQASAVDGSS